LINFYSQERPRKLENSTTVVNFRKLKPNRKSDDDDDDDDDAVHTMYSQSSQSADC